MGKTDKDETKSTCNIRLRQIRLRKGGNDFDGLINRTICNRGAAARDKIMQIPR